LTAFAREGLHRVRTALFVAAVVAAAAAIPPGALFGALATAASALFEATPFALAGIALGRLTRRPDAAVFFGCGCGHGPSARSIPALAATWAVFGPLVAIARFLSAVVVARVARSRLPGGGACDAPRRRSHLLGELAALLPSALVAGAVGQLQIFASASHLSLLAQVAGGALLGFAASPCGIGAAAVGGALHQRSPLAASAFLCVAGIVDLRAIVRRPHRAPERDALAFVLLAFGLAVVGWRHGDALVHPSLAIVLLVCAAACGVTALRCGRRRDAGCLPAPALMLAGALVAVPPPAYRATETTLADAFPGERLTFTGTLVRTPHSAALVRYAMTCCRADASPVVVRLSAAPAFDDGTWLRADGSVAIVEGEPQLIAQRVDRIAPPADPFTYR
jgi:hypothetical protein